MRLLVVVHEHHHFEEFLKLYFPNIDPSRYAHIVMVRGEHMPPMDKGTIHIATYVSGSIDLYEKLCREGGAVPVVVLDQWLPKV